MFRLILPGLGTIIHMRTSLPIPPVVQALADQVVTFLTDRVVGVYLGGSYTMGDFSPATSDFDVLIVTRGSLAPDDLAALAQLHQRLLEEHPEAHRLEGDYAPLHQLVPSGTTAPVPDFRDGIFEPDVQEIMLSADNLANMREHGLAVYGPPAADILPPVSPDDVRAAVLEMLHEGSDEIKSEQDAAREILNLVRSLRSLESGRPATKSEGVAWALRELNPRWHPMVRRAADVRLGAIVADDDRRLRGAFPKLDAALRTQYTANT